MHSSTSTNNFNGNLTNKKLVPFMFILARTNTLKSSELALPNIIRYYSQLLKRIKTNRCKRRGKRIRKICSMYVYKRVEIKTGKWRHTQ